MCVAFLAAFIVFHKEPQMKPFQYRQDITKIRWAKYGIKRYRIAQQFDIRLDSITAMPSAKYLSDVNILTTNDMVRYFSKSSYICIWRDHLCAYWCTWDPVFRAAIRDYTG